MEACWCTYTPHSPVGALAWHRHVMILCAHRSPLVAQAEKEALHMVIVLCPSLQTQIHRECTLPTWYPVAAARIEQLGSGTRTSSSVAAARTEQGSRPRNSGRSRTSFGSDAESERKALARRRQASRSAARGKASIQVPEAGRAVQGGRVGASAQAHTRAATHQGQRQSHPEVGSRRWRRS